MRLPSRRRALACLGVATGLAGWAGCAAIAGIQDGVLASSDSGGGGDDTTIGEGGNDAHPGEGGGSEGGLDSTTDSPVDSPTTSPELACAILPNSKVLVSDLSTSDSGSTTFAHALFLARSNAGDEVYVVAQLSSDQTQFIDYQVSFGQGSANPLPFTGVSSSIQLLDVQSIGSTNLALAAYGTFSGGGPLQVMEIVPLPYAGPPQLPYSLASSTFGAGDTSARLLMQPAGADEYVAAMHVTGGLFGYFVRAGQGDNADGGSSMTLLHSTTQSWDVASAPIVVAGGTVYTFVNQALADGGTGVFSYPAGTVDGGFTTSGVGTTAPLAVVVGAQTDPSNASNVEVMALTSQNGTSAQFWGASVAPSALTSLTIGTPQFKQGALLPTSDVPFDRGTSAWMGAEYLGIGTPGDNSGGVVLLWLGPDGHVVSRTATSGKLVSTANTISLSSVLSLGNFGENTATLAVAWIEQIVTDAGTRYEQLFVAKVGCQPIATGG